MRMSSLRRWLGRPSRRFAIVGIVFLGLFLLVGFGLLLSNTYGASRVAENASRLHWANATKGAAGIARASVAQAVFFSYEEFADPEAKESAVAEARVNLEAVAGAAESEHSTSDIDKALSNYVLVAGKTVDIAEAGQAPEAESLRTTIAEREFGDLITALDARQSELTAVIEQSDEISGQISRITFVAIAFMIPAVAMVVFWFALRRRMSVREAEMAAQVEAERELNRAKDDLIAGLSHELRTPLTTIFGFSEILFNDSSVDGEAHELLGLINASSADLSRMVNDLLTAARLNADALTTKLERVDLRVEVDTVTEPYLRSGEALEVRVPSLEVYSDPLHVRQIVHNLVSNALRHGGNEILISASYGKGRVVLVVADNGKGIPDSMADRLFKRFANKGKSAVVAGSVGLGLAISQELASNIGGSLRYSRVDGWTTFSLSLPAMLSRSGVMKPTYEQPIPIHDRP